MNKRLTSSVLAGFVAGAVVTALLEQGKGDSPATWGSAGSGGIDAGQPSAIAAPVRGPFASLVSEYAAVADLDDVNVLASKLEETLRRPVSLARNRTLEALATRLFEIDPSYAADALLRSGLPQRQLSSVFKAWARIDTQASIELLGDIRDPATLRLAALAIAEVGGADVIDRMASEVPALEAESLRAAVLVQRARTDPSGALQGVLELKGSDAQELAIAEVGRVAASLDPAAAAAAASSIPSAELKRAYLMDVYERWSLADVPQFLDHLGALQTDQLALLLEGTLERPGQNETPFGGSIARMQGLASPLSSALALAAESEPARVLEFGQEVGGSLGIVAEASALEVIAAGNPSTAMAYLGASPNGFRRDVLTAAIASGYARNDVDVALAWATALSPPNEQAERAVMTAIAAADLARALRIELADLDTRQGALVNSPSIPSWFASRLVGDLDDPVGIIGQILAAEENGFWEQNMLTTALSRWSNSDPGGAIAWMRANRDNVPADALQSVVEQLGEVDIERRLSLADMLTPERRGDWIMDSILGVEDPHAAMAMAERYRSEPFHDFMVGSLISRVAVLNGPREAAQLLGATPPSIGVMSIARRWAETEPLEAAAWATGLPTAEARTTAMEEIAETWAQRDLDAATQWVRSLSDPELEQRALATICRRNPQAAECG